MNRQTVDDNSNGGKFDDKHDSKSLVDDFPIKLAQEINSWRQSRAISKVSKLEHDFRPKTSFEPVRTIKIRGHETLVIHKPKPSTRHRQQGH